MEKISKFERDNFLENLEVNLGEHVFAVDRSSLSDMKDAYDFLKGILDLEIPIPTEENPEPENPLKYFSLEEQYSIMAVKQMGKALYPTKNNGWAWLSLGEFEIIMVKAQIGKFNIEEKFKIRE